MLVLEDVHTYYGASHVLHGVSLTVGSGEAVAVLGRNGVGKTTTMRSIVGLTPPRQGRVVFDGHDVAGRRTDVIARRGMAFVASGRRTFSTLTVGQHLTLVDRRVRNERRWTIDRITKMFPKLRELWNRRAGHLSGGEQQMLKLAMALLAEPKLLLLDEPTEGLAPTVVGDLVRWIEELRNEGLSILLSEQNARFALRLADRGYLMDKGVVLHEGSAGELRGSPELSRFLGV